VVHLSLEDSAVNRNALCARIPQLLQARKQLSGRDVVEELLLLAIDSTLPLGYSPHQRVGIKYEGPASFVELTEQAKTRWVRRAQPLICDIPLDDFLYSNPWTASTPTIISSILYKQGSHPRQFERWLGSENCSSRPNEHFAVIVQAALDIYSCLSPNMDSLIPEVWIPHFPRIAALCFDSGIDTSIRLVSASCMELAIDIFADRSEELICLLKQQVDERLRSQPTLEAVRLGLHPEFAPIVQDWAFQWLIDKLAGDVTLSPNTLQLITVTGKLSRSRTVLVTD
jgi:nucleolar pre-ribosomal-associated protein 1